MINISQYPYTYALMLLLSRKLRVHYCRHKADGCVQETSAITRGTGREVGSLPSVSAFRESAQRISNEILIKIKVKVF